MITWVFCNNRLILHSPCFKETQPSAILCLAVCTLSHSGLEAVKIKHATKLPSACSSFTCQLARPRTPRWLFSQLSSSHYSTMTLLSICIKIGEKNMQNSIIANPVTVGEEYIHVHVHWVSENVTSCLKQNLCLQTIRDSFLNNSNGSSDELEGLG